MRKLAVTIALLAVFMMLTGCAAAVTYGPRGAPLGLYVDEDGPVMVTENQVGTKRGESCSQSILGLVVTGDASIVTAAQNGGISRIGTVNSSYQNILGIIATYCIVVTGE